MVDKVLTRNKSAYKYENPSKGLYEIDKMWTNGTITLQTVAVTTIINIGNIKPFNNPNVDGRSPIQEM